MAGGDRPCYGCYPHGVLAPPDQPRTLVDGAVRARRSVGTDSPTVTRGATALDPLATPRGSAPPGGPDYGAPDHGDEGCTRAGDAHHKSGPSLLPAIPRPKLANRQKIFLPFSGVTG